MPKYISAEKSNDQDEYEEVYHAISKITQCRGHRKGVWPCRNRCILGYEYCHHHLTTEKHLTVRCQL